MNKIDPGSFFSMPEPPWVELGVRWDRGSKMSNDSG